MSTRKSICYVDTLGNYLGVSDSGPRTDWPAALEVPHAPEHAADKWDFIGQQWILDRNARQQTARDEVSNRLNAEELKAFVKVIADRFNTTPEVIRAELLQAASSSAR